MATNREIIALDVGGSSVKSGLVDLETLTVTHFTITPIDSKGTAERIIGTLVQVIRMYDAVSDVRVGMGFPGPCDYDAGISYIDGVDKYEAIYGLNVLEAVTKTFADDIDIRMRNDAEAAIVGEGVYGVGRGYSRVIGLTLGTGCGSAFLVDGVPQTSGDGIPENGWVYPILFKGEQADDVFSTRGLMRRLADAGIAVDSVEQAVERAGDDGAIRAVLAQFGEDLAAFVQPIADNFRADVLILQGGIAQGFDYFGEQTRAKLTLPVKVGVLERDAALLGAANLFKN